MPLVNHEKVLHSHLLSGEIEVFASDWLALNHTIARGNSVCLFIQSLSIKSIKRIFSSLSEGAETTDPLSNIFFGTYGALNDRFGVRWMFQSEE